MRKPHVLKIDKGGGKYNRVIYFDSESRLEEVKDILGERIIHRPYLVCATFNDYRFNRSWSKDFYGDGFLDRFWEDVNRFSKRGRTLMVAHNANYDVLVTGGIPRLVKAGFRASSFFSQGTVFILDMKNDKRTISIISSTNIYSTSLAKLGTTFGIPKMEVDYNMSTLEEVIPYCRNDVRIMQTAMEAFFAFVEREELGSLARTIAGQAFNAYRHRFMQLPIFIHSDPEALALERQAYTGGRVELFYRGQYPGTVTYLDVNSMYPFVMHSHLFPTKIVTRKTYITLDELREYLVDYLAVARVTVETDEPVYPVRNAGCLMFPVGTFETTLSTPEIEYALNRGHILKVHEANLYEPGDIFSSYVSYFYGKRTAAKSASDSVHSELYKLCLNSLYGKFGQRGDKWEKVGDAKPEEIYQETVYDFETKELRKVKAFGGSVFQKIDETESYNSFPAVACHVTAYARMTLWRYMQIAGMEHVLYADTDSLFVDETGRQNLESFLDPKTLGAMKIEDTSDRVFLNAPKDYRFGDRIKHKGIPASADKTEQGYKVVIWGKLSGSLRNRDLDGYQNEIRYKQDSNRYLKAWILEDGKALPFTIKNGEIQEPSGMVLKDPAQLAYVFKRYKQFTAEQQEELLMKEARKESDIYMKQLRKAILSLGGVRDSLYKVPVYLRRKKGYGLDELRTELTSLGFVFQDTEELYEFLTGRG